jgi:protein-S-isoprenylcysteine O-methyltransferase Ste14
MPGRPLDRFTPWRNIPLPEPHRGGLLAGGGLHLVWPSTMGTMTALRLAGALVALGGLALIAWAVRAAAPVSLARSDRLVVTGPYARSRDPMYVGWTVSYLGTALAADSAWLVLLLPAVLLLTHITVLGEERTLRAKLDDAYRRYTVRVRRYL